MKIVAISDTHCHEPELEPADILLHAGDFTMSGNRKETEAAMRWLGREANKFKWVVCVAGNHDFFFEHAGPIVSRHFIDEYSGTDNIIYLQNEEYTVEGIKVFGSPYTPFFYNWAFNEFRGSAIKKHWDSIPKDVNIVLTHGPPSGILDYTGENVGCKDLFDTIQRVKPKFNIFGHIHCAYGYIKFNGTEYFNASLVGENYKLKNEPWIIEL